MKISILCPDLSGNCLGRAYILAKILQRHYEIEIVGPVFGNSIWPPLSQDKTVVYKTVKFNSRFKPYFQINELINKIDGDVIYVSKPLFTSLGTGLLKKLFCKIPVILDIDDWEMGFMNAIYNKIPFFQRIKSFSYAALYLYRIDSYWNSLLHEKLIPYVNEITVSNRFLQKKFKGEIIWHTRDVKVFNPDKTSKTLSREIHKIDKHNKVVMFFGTPRPYKGIEDLITAMSLIKDPNIILVIVGLDRKNEYDRKLEKTAQQILSNRFTAFALQPFEKIPEFLSISDVVVIPQRNTLATQGQVPAKIFDAMAMARPVIATDVSDMSEILEGCGWIIEPEKPEILAKTIQYVLEHPEEAARKGESARQKCIEKYSWDAMEKKLIEIFLKYE
jgi:glycosyltransferase involved in cell wall biosynthesis